MFNDKRR